MQVSISSINGQAFPWGAVQTVDEFSESGPFSQDLACRISAWIQLLQMLFVTNLYGVHAKVSILSDKNRYHTLFMFISYSCHTSFPL